MARRALGTRGNVYVIQCQVTFYHSVYTGVLLSPPTSGCVLFDGENISFDASLVIYIYIYIYIVLIFLQL